MGGTYAGNAVACAAATASAEVMQEEKVLHNVSVRSAELFAALDELRKEPEVSPHILDVRGVGLMVGVEFSSPSQSTNDPFAAPNGLPNLAARISKRCQEKGLFILTTSLYQVIRFVPPLNITQADMAKGLSIFREAVREVVRES